MHLNLEKYCGEKTSYFTTFYLRNLKFSKYLSMLETWLIFVISNSQACFFLIDKAKNNCMNWIVLFQCPDEKRKIQNWVTNWVSSNCIKRGLNSSMNSLFPSKKAGFPKAPILAHLFRFPGSLIPQIHQIFIFKKFEKIFFHQNFYCSLILFWVWIEACKCYLKYLSN